MGARLARLPSRLLLRTPLLGARVLRSRSVRMVGLTPPIVATELKSAVSEDDGLQCLLHAAADLLALLGAHTSRSDTLTTDGWAPVVDCVERNASIYESLVDAQVAPRVSVPAG